ncbi:MAG: MBL fold metallo-hydrolase [Halioglobus sp.]|nr:MBL fold metallo-hydrolase [Halioglobus sp.]MCB1709848.1 MBL fold metallo-hydrolase [Halioglobus sp.]MCP5122265.1 MBL fold metallo-hydrolase [Pseudomonadales bacterium]MCP5192190.1 MBL fold metallo-hydrolase [Pseudomonadales bacterium]
MNSPVQTVIASAVKPEVTTFFDEPTNTLSYVVKDPASAACAVIDSVMNLDYPSGSISFTGADQIIAFITAHKLQLEWILETHVHADHLSAAPYIQQRLGGRIAIGFNISVVQETFGRVFNAEPGFARDGSQFDLLLREGDTIRIGQLAGTSMHTPGHTPACMTYVLGDAVFVGDTLFMPDGGTARADFPGGDAHTLYRSIQRILSLPEDMRIFVCHDYLPNGRELEYETTVGAELQANIHVHRGISESVFVEMRKTRDATLGMPSLILPSLQVNMRAGHFPPADASGQLFLKLPVNAFGGADISSLIS